MGDFPSKEHKNYRIDMQKMPFRGHTSSLQIVLCLCLLSATGAGAAADTKPRTTGSEPPAENAESEEKIILVPASLDLARQLVRAGRLQQALEVLATLHGSPQADPIEIELLGAIIELGLRRPQAAMTRMLALLEKNPELIPAQQQLARAFINMGETDKAWVLLQKLKNEPEAEQTEIEFLLGLHALQKKDYQQAAKNFRHILKDHPGQMRVRLELARSLFAAGEDESARYHFEQVIAASPPAGVLPSIQKFLDAIRARRGWQFHIGMGISPDTNINTAPSSNSIRIGDLLFDLQPDSQKQSGIGLNWEIGTLWQHPISPAWRLIARGTGHQRDYRGSIADDTFARTSLGLRRLRPGGATELSLLLGHRWFAHRPYNYQFGLDLTNEHRFRHRISLRETVQFIERRYRRSPRADGHTLYISGQTVLGLNATSSIDLDLAFTRTIAKNSSLSSFSPAIAGGWRHEFPRGISARLGMRYSRARYDAPSAFGNVRRDEQRISFTLSLRKRDWNLFGFAPEIAISQERNLSNIEFYEYNRVRFNFGVSKQF